ncbi:hypothetical protein Y032_0044g911 [Ancylostoma ceylanicum]|uniref:Uncharacterized protein n=2 Tax=Ancylostoma ceylanicum TaxID=53326 RepID=A0A016UDR9_9BILA|nr:hypothetical protein Y032_0044g911 [Ancylostoma ceylanicum]
MQRVHFCGNGATVSEGREKPGEGSNVEIRRRVLRCDKGAPASKGGEMPEDGSNCVIRIENETALVEPSTEKGDANIDKSGTSFLMDGRESIHTPCSVAHNAYVERVEQAGCQGAIG